MANDLYPRHLQAELIRALASARVVNVIGPRQAGKTTLVRDLFQGAGRFVTLDDTGVLRALKEDPKGQLDLLSAQAGDAPLVIDEAQRSTELAVAIKQLVDQRRRMGQFLLTGSSNVFTTAHVADSLAGRVRTLKLLPLSAAELHRAGPALLLDWASQNNEARMAETLPRPLGYTWAQYVNLIVRGGYPEIRDLEHRERQSRYLDYVDTVVDKDVADVLKIRKTDAMRRMVEQLAVRTASELNVQALSGLIGAQRPTVESYLDVLERLSLAIRLGAWASGEAKREARRPKIHLIDTGIAAALRNLDAAAFAADADPTVLGALLESFVHTELRKSLPSQQDTWRLYHWRDADRYEIDILAESGRTLVAVEVKAAAEVSHDDLRNIRWFKARGSGKARQVTSLVIYLGSQVLTFGDRVFALPLSVFWSFGTFARKGASGGTGRRRQRRS